MKQYTVFLGFLAGILTVSAAVWFFALTQSLTELDRRARSDLALASDRLMGSLLGYRQLAVALASDPRLGSATTNEQTLSQILLHMSDISGALDFVLLDRAGDRVASAMGTTPHDWPSTTFVDRALSGALGHGVGISHRFGRRVYYYAAPVFSETGPVSRVIVAIIDLEAIEAEFRGSRPAVYMTDRSGVIFFSNRSELILRDRNLGTEEGAAQGEDETIAPFVDVEPGTFLGRDIWRVSAGRYLPQRALHIEQDLPVIGMHAEALVDLRPALTDAALQAAAAGAVFLFFGAVVFFVANQRRILARANAELEERVSGRTRELRQVNASLRTEILERKEAEKALKRAQKDLIQAGKLSALGKMSAGISHELNQPLMAIRSFSDNAATFIERGDADTAASNMLKVRDLALRMARIIGNFRAFARQEKETVHRVDLVQATGDAIDLAASRLDAKGVDLQLDLPAGPVWVQGGEVRLQQVVLNLVSNAIDAMSQSNRRELSVSVQIGTPIVLTVRDTGPGIEEPDKVFEPFYSTKEIGEAEGVGLGLSISYGLVQSFGGKIRGRNADGGGAVFTIELQPWAEEIAA
ncbi:MAG: ATP-binding protein [Rhodobacter sp.]|nr:ATP-binding protein [Rhodobacter sp.]